METFPTSKKELALRLLREGGLLVGVDPRGEEVSIPFRFKHLSEVVLPIGLGADSVPADLVLDDDGIRCTLRFNRLVWPCRFAWKSVSVLLGEDGQGALWSAEDGVTSEGVPTTAHAQGWNYLAINGQAIVGQGWSCLVVDGREVCGAKWIEWRGLTVRIGGSLSELRGHFARRTSQGSSTKSMRLQVQLGFTSGRQNCTVEWQDCIPREGGDSVCELKAGSFYEFRVGTGCGILAHIKDLLASLKRRWTSPASQLESATRTLPRR